MEFFLLDIFIVHPLLGYLIIFFGLFVEGDLLLFAAAFLARLGVFDLLPLVVVSIAGMLIGDTLWYTLGKYHRRLPTRLVTFYDRVASPFDQMLTTRLFHTLLITKFTYGIHRLILARAGSVGASFVRFFKTDIVATLIWTATIVTIGYFGGFALEALKEYVRFAEIGLLILLVLVVFAEKWLRKRVLR